jgi:beta-glucosidase
MDKLNERVRLGNIDLMMIGDSITQDWELPDNRSTWQHYYGHRNAVNFGVGSDRTQHLLWRLHNGNLDGISPKLAVLMIGTNNATHDVPTEIAEGIQAILKILRTRLPAMKVLVLGIFPRGESDSDPFRRVNTETNEIIGKWTRRVRDSQLEYLDIGDAFLEDGGILSSEMAPGLLHLSPAAHRVWAAAIEPSVARMFGDSPVEPQ